MEIDHIAVLVGMRIREKWRYVVRKNEEVKTLAIMKMNQK